MKPVLLGIISLLCWILPGAGFLYAQTDTGAKKVIDAAKKLADSERNVILTRQSEELQAEKAVQLADSMRLLQLTEEILVLGHGDDKKKQVLATEQDQIRIKDSLRVINQKLKIDSLRSRVRGFPVYISNDTLFYVYSKIGSFSPKEQAVIIMNRIQKLIDNYYYSPDSLRVIHYELSSDINYQDNVIMSITELDAIWARSTKEKLAIDYADRIRKGVNAYKKENSFSAILKNILLTLGVLALLSLMIYSVTKLFRWIKRTIESQKGIKIKGIKIRSYEFLDAESQVRVLLTIFKLLRWFIIVNLIYWTLTVLIGFFPFTGGYAPRLISFFFDPIKNIFISIWNYLPNLITIVVLVIFFRYLLRLLFYFKKEIERGALRIPGFYVDWANPTFQIVRVLVLAFMVIVIFPYLPGSDSQIFKGVSVFLGVLFTFGSAGALGNVVAGLVLTYMRAYRIGDRVQIGDATGDVIEKSILVTKIITIKNEIISIPNSTVMSSHTKNFSAEADEFGLILHTTVTIGYDNPWRQIHELLISAALATELIEKEPAPFVFQTSLNDFYVSYQINAYTKAANLQHVTYSQLHQNIQDAFNAAGVEIMSSHYSNIRDGNKSTVPADHLPEDYITPSFRVKQTGEDSK